jgi:hypothetical protein
MKINIIWDIALCTPVEIYLRFGGTYCLNLQGQRVALLEVCFLLVSCGRYLATDAESSFSNISIHHNMYEVSPPANISFVLFWRPLHFAYMKSQYGVRQYSERIPFTFKNI